ncbi:alkaline phosphatase family protein [Labilibacter marinus]|uniref:alkaline phosphatase family protein n=1 Tax=Labilibacter marinus TaxID=1477105 RepID=UPI000830224B|nr:alkaline phosphatase family protein [Labilibacter marinus]
MKLSLVLIIFLYSIHSLSAQNDYEVQPPKLVVFLNLDELRTEHLITFREKFGKFGFNQLVNNGTFYHKGDFKTSTYFSGTKLVNMHTGCYPSTHGIIGESWFASNKEKEEHASSFITVDETAQPDSGRIVFPHLHASTIADELNIFYKGKSKIAAISLVPEDMAYQGHVDEDLSFWFNRTTGEMTNSHDSIPKPWVAKYNSMKFQDIYLDRHWGPLRELRKYQEFVSENPIKPRHFMYNKKSNNPLTPYQKIIGSPSGNVLLRDFAAALLINEELGKDEYTDMLSISLSCNPFLERPQEMFDMELEDMLLRMDLQIESLIQLIKDNVGLEHTLFVLNSTPTTGWLPETLAKNKVNTGIFNGRKTAALLNLYLMAIYGQGKWVKGYHDKQFYFNHKLLDEQKITIEEIQDKSAKFLLEVSGIEKTITAYHLRVNEYTTGAFSEFQQNYFYGRSGDLFVALKPGWTEEIHNTKEIKFEQKCYAPLIFFGWNIKTAQLFDPIDMIDVAPTISTILEITEPNGCIGKPLKEIVQ